MTEVWSTVAAAKLNLTLEVLGRRDDGYHELSSIATSLDLVDEVQLETSSKSRSVAYVDDAGYRVSILTSDDITLRAWDALTRRSEAPITGAVRVVKRIPITSGLGGGSTDAAAFLRLARQAWRLELSDVELQEVAAEVGSDVAACLAGGLVRMSGRGERVKALTVPESTFEDCAIVLYRPEIPVPAAKTATMYRSLRSSDWLDGSASERLRRVLEQGRPLSQYWCVNSFDRVAREVMTGLTPSWRAFGVAIAEATTAQQQRPVVPLLAGAGPTMFAVVSPEVATSVSEALVGSRGFSVIARPLGRQAATRVWQT